MQLQIEKSDTIMGVTGGTYCVNPIVICNGSLLMRMSAMDVFAPLGISMSCNFKLKSLTQHGCD